MYVVLVFVVKDTSTIIFSANTETKLVRGPPPPYASGPRSPNQPAGYEYIDSAADIQKYFAPL